MGDFQALLFSFIVRESFFAMRHLLSQEEAYNHSQAIHVHAERSFKQLRPGQEGWCRKRTLSYKRKGIWKERSNSSEAQPAA